MPTLQSIAFLYQLFMQTTVMLLHDLRVRSNSVDSCIIDLSLLCLGNFYFAFMFFRLGVCVARRYIRELQKIKHPNLFLIKYI